MRMRAQIWRVDTACRQDWAGPGGAPGGLIASNASSNSQGTSDARHHSAVTASSVSGATRDLSEAALVSGRVIFRCVERRDNRRECSPGVLIGPVAVFPASVPCMRPPFSSLFRWQTLPKLTRSEVLGCSELPGRTHRTPAGGGGTTAPRHQGIKA